MAGHSKWANIKHRKGAQDAKRGKIFTKLIKEITVSAKEGGPDSETNPRLRLAIQNAKGANMPKDTIERAINKATGADAADYLELTYEGYAPNGVAVYVECSTDNQNRTVSNVRSIFNKNGGSLGKNGSLEFIFDRKGIFNFALPEGMNEDDLQLELIDAGAEDVEIEDNYVVVTSAMEDFGSVNNKLTEMSIETENAGLQRIPNTTVELDDETFVKVMKLIDKLEDDDDVQKVYHNLEIKESQIALLD
ncbi:YebC/PmpR family DNA-binding transcriptional regulator [Rapidithrix thailandica]|uniref:Probable transcriptional regulatory protein AAG747_08980 n=1 Tax=Rapidithrix thailandica TaxID=413964 RepID=A0AAW9RWJ0_9BACT